MAGEHSPLLRKVSHQTMPSNVLLLWRIAKPSVQLASCAMVLGLTFLLMLMAVARPMW